MAMRCIYAWYSFMAGGSGADSRVTNNGNGREVLYNGS